MASGNYFGTNGQLQPDILSAGRQFNSQTISSGAITYTYTLSKLSAESGTTDDLTTISSADVGDTIIIKAATGHTITAKTTGNIALSADYEISGNTTLTLVYDGTNWCPLGAASSSEHNIDYGFVNRTSNQTISTGTWTTIQFNNAVDDNNSLWDGSNYRFDIATSGIYSYEYRLLWQNNSTGYRWVKLQVLTSAGLTAESYWYHALGSAINGNNAANSFMGNSGLAYLAAGQKFQLDAFQNSGSNLFIVGAAPSSPYYTYFKIARLGGRS